MWGAKAVRPFSTQVPYNLLNQFCVAMATGDRRHLVLGGVFVTQGIPEEVIRPANDPNIHRAL